MLGEALRLIRSSRSGSLELPDGEVLIGMEDGTDRDSYVADLLTDAEHEILSRMLKAAPEHS